KKTAKKATKKVATSSVKKSETKSTKKKAAPKKAATSSKKKESKKEVKETVDSGKLTKEQAIALYKEKNQVTIDSELKDSLKEYELEDKIEAKGENTLEIDEAVEDQMETTAPAKTEVDPLLEEEYNPDDNEGDDSSQFGYGWGYNDAFDKPDEEEEPDLLDEDERYALGLDKDDK
ncbi:histone protein, partial [Halobacteriovorax sp. GB3]|nr:histone protein [Halobacteriovorax sp. GB3]